MVPRLQKLVNSDSYFVFGARGTGKSTLVEHYFQNRPGVLMINLLDLELESRYRRQPMLLQDEVLAQKNLEWVIIDEVQKVPKLLDVVHKLIESTDVKFVLTGSSARKLKRGGANLLAGRALVFKLFPFSSFEVDDSSPKSLETLLHWGGLPQVYLTEEDAIKAKRLNAYALTYLKEEIQEEQIVRQIEPFHEFLEVAAQCNGKVINYSNIARDVGVDHKTIKSYYQILEDTLLGFHLPSYHRSIRKSQAKSPKFYLFDTGVKRALERTLDIPLKPGTSAYGEAFEHWVIMEAFKLNEIFECGFRLSHFRTNDHQKIDLILSKPSRTVVIEIKSGRSIDDPRVKKFSKVASEFGKAEKYWLSQDSISRDLGEVRCRGWREGLREIFKIHSL